MYRIGRGVDRSKDAVALYRRAAWKKNGNAMFNLGTADYNGDGVGIDDATSYAWFRLAQENGSNNADDAVRRTDLELPSRKINEGFRKTAGFYVNGVDLPKDYAESAKWLRKSR
jgi:TPR repeat protein